MQVPTVQGIKTLHQKYAPSDEVFDLVWKHCCIVSDIALQLCSGRGLAVDMDRLQAGCLLHDIGVYPLLGADGKLLPGVQYITHGVEGEAILRKEGFPEVIWRFASHHTGVGLTRRDITSQKLPLPAADYLAETDEELLVMYADKFHSKTTPPYFNSFAWYKQDVAKFGAHKAAKFAQMAERFGVPDLAALSKKYGYRIR